MNLVKWLSLSHTQEVCKTGQSWCFSPKFLAVDGCSVQCLLSMKAEDVQSGNRSLSYSWCVPALGNLLGLLKCLLCWLCMFSSLVCICFHFSCDNILLLALILKNVLPFRTQLRLWLCELCNCKRCRKSNKHIEWPQTSVKNNQGRSSSVFYENGIVINFILMVKFVCSQLQQAWIWEESSVLKQLSIWRSPFLIFPPFLQ